MVETRNQEPTEKPARSEERRNKTRVLISAPVRLRSLEDTESSLEDATTTVNISATGILINTANPAYYRGMKVRVTLPYTEAAEATQAEQAGHIVRIVELHDGHRSVAIALGAGAGKDVVNRGEKKTQESARPLVLVVESENVASEFMKTYLTAEGYEVIAVRTVAEARLVLDLRTPSLLISEIEGKEKPGYVLCSHCKETPRLKRIPIMLMTSSAYPSDYAKAHSLGAVVCMAKPYKRERLGHVVKLLAPPPDANKETMPPRPGDSSRRAGRIDQSPGHAKGTKKFSLLRRTPH